MNGNNFTEEVRTVLEMSREESSRLHHEYVGTEHQLLGLLREEDGMAAKALASLNVDARELRLSVERALLPGKASHPTGPHLPYTSRAKKALELSMLEALELGHYSVWTEHLLLGLVLEEKGIAAQVLRSHGVTLATAREAVLRVLGVT